MAGLHQSIRPNSSFSSFSSNSTQNILYKLLLLLTLLPLFLAIFAFFLQWRGGFGFGFGFGFNGIDHQFPGMLPSSDLHYNGIHKKSSSSSLSHDNCGINVLKQSNSPVFPYFRNWGFNFNHSNLGPKICITTSTSAGLEQILPWIYYHKVIGITNFFLFVEGKAASHNVSKVLESIEGVKVVYRTRELEEQQLKSRIWNETWLSSFFYKPCNNELFVKQTLNMEMAIVMARDAGMEWIFHLDTDELLHPAGTREYSVRELLTELPRDVDMVVFPNYESAVERNDIKEPFSEVSMFKKNFDHLPRETYFGLYRDSTRGNPNYFLTYGNGKAAARIQDHLRPNGAHRWHNYRKTPKEIKMDEAAVLHYTYSKFSDLTSRRDRCGCKPTKEDVKRCFMLEFDRSAFIIASTATDEEMLQWYQEHVVWNDEKLRLKLLKHGILTRIYTPMVIIEGLRESGVFSSVIASAQAGSSETMKSSSHRMNVSMEKVVVGRLVSRKVLEIGESDIPEAVPPLSPPTIDVLTQESRSYDQ
ncbi:hypothetical protein RND81_14G039700 [Saponaria officinalis]|uniref:Glycosyltransferase family 92 protein n=1 Tax=Saponaria officinalis TaxID=3572 RepID=A0AAW1GI99_SAPOF